MTDPLRLLDGQLSYQERSLLESARAEVPDEGTARRMLAPLGLVGMAHGMTGGQTLDAGAAALKSAREQAAQQGTLSSTTGVSAPASIPPAGAWLLGSTAQWVSAIAVLGGLGAGAAWTFSQAQDESPADVGPRPVVHTEDVAPPSRVRELALPVESARELRAEPAPVADSPDASVPSVRAADTAPPSLREPANGSTGAQRGSPSTVTGEIVLLDEVRLHLRQGEPGAALDLLGGYDRRFPHGSLKPEAQVLRERARELLGEIRHHERSPSR